MNNYLNDPLGALSKGLSSANQVITTNVKKAADNIKNNENLRSGLQSAKEKGYSGYSYSSTVVGSAASNFKENA